MNNRMNAVSGAATGALAGAIGVWALDRVTWWMYRRQSPDTLAQEDRARPSGLDPAHVMADRVGRRFGMGGPPQQPTVGGMVVHYMLGILPGAIYGMLPRRGVSIGRGTLFGLGLFVVQDELANWALGTSGAPGRYPPITHLRGAIGHAVYGAVTEAALAALPPARERDTPAGSRAPRRESFVQRVTAHLAPVTGDRSG